ncbi:MAG: DUF1491 family protein [Pseudomonadota bacterium]
MAELKTRMWVEALRWRAEGAGASVYVAHRGDADAGAVVVKVSLLDGTAQLYTPTRTLEGERCWVAPLGEEPLVEARADAYANRRLEDDPDLWVIEIEDRYGRHFLTEPVEKF